VTQIELCHRSCSLLHSPQKCILLTMHPPITIISKTLHFRFIRLMMYVVYTKDYVHHLLNEYKMQSFAYNSD